MVNTAEIAQNELSIQQYQQSLNEILMNSSDNNSTSELLKLPHVFDFIAKNVNKIGEDVHMTDILPLLHYSIRLETKTGSKIQIGEYICALLELNKNDLKVIQHSVQLLYQILQTLSPEDTQLLIIGDNVFLRLMQIMEEPNTLSIIKANILACIQLYDRKFKSSNILSILWERIETTISTANIAPEDNSTLMTLIILFDDFEHVTNFKQIMQTMFLMEKLLKSQEHDKRKCAYFLLKKSYPFLKGTPQFWIACISIFENLEENQTHLILPSLELLKNMKANSSQELSWINILHCKILEHNNILVRRWILEYFLEYKSLKNLPTEIKLQLLQAFNDTALYNVEGYMLPEQHIKTFLDCNRTDFFKCFCAVNWKTVPLHYWLSKLLQYWNPIDVKDISNDVDSKSVEKILLNLAAKIRVLQNVVLRREIIEIYGKLFAGPLAKMDFLSYIELIKALYNVSDPFGNVKLLSQKLKAFPLNIMEVNGDYVFDQRFYDIITNQIMLPCNNFQQWLGDVLYEKLENVKSKWQGYLRFIIIFDLNQSEKKQAFCQQYYDLDMKKLYKMQNFHDLYSLLCEKFGKMADYKIFLRRKTIDFYLCKTKFFKTFDDLSKSDLKIHELLNAGSYVTLLRITKLLAEHKKHVGFSIIENIIDNLRDHLKNNFVCFKVCANLIKYFKNVFEPEDCSFWTKKLLELDLENLSITGAIFLKETIELKNVKFLLQGALNGDAKTRDARIEDSYMRKFTLRWVKSYRVRRDYVRQITTNESDSTKQAILINICEMAKELNLKKPRYFAHSKEHRLLTRIAYILYNLIEIEIEASKRHEIFQKIWSLLMEHNNQPNVTVIYECSIVRFVDFTSLFDKIQALQSASKHTSSQEVSMIMLFYRFFEVNFKCTSLNDLCKVFTFLWPLTMGSSFQTRLYAQLVLVALINKLEDHCKNCLEKHVLSFEMQTYQQLKTVIEQTIGKEEIVTFLEDFRFTPINTVNFFNEVMYLTLTPYDEYNKASKHFNNEHKLPKKKLIENAKGEVQSETNKNKHCNSISVTANSQSDVQRKMNPVADFMPQANLISYPEYKEHEFYVVASLIDKIPNLGGIARTCEVLGIHNLVIDSKSHITKADFKNLSMTAEKSLNIIEVKPSNLQKFLIQKKSEGFEIVGAEQTVNSCNFVDFIFPKRCVLLLGHEKEGIPANLLYFLDYAVEIPQFGMVRSLNVHVTGALFMWEYCKQNIVKKSN